MNRFFLILALTIIFASCKQVNKNGRFTSTKSGLVEFNHTALNQYLSEISNDYTISNKINNSVIEVIVDKKTPDVVYLILTCRGLYYFEVEKLRPLFTYEQNNNSFFVFTGVEDLLNITFNYEAFEMRNKERCENLQRTCYRIEDGKWRKELNCRFPFPFSNTGPEVQPPKKKNN